MLWGLIPHWAKDDSVKLQTINARVERIGELHLNTYLAVLVLLHGRDFPNALAMRPSRWQNILSSL
jgi:hypothetical protein